MPSFHTFVQVRLFHSVSLMVVTSGVLHSSMHSRLSTRLFVSSVDRIASSSPHQARYSTVQSPSRVRCQRMATKRMQLCRPTFVSGSLLPKRSVQRLPSSHEAFVKVRQAFRL